MFIYNICIKFVYKVIFSGNFIMHSSVQKLINIQNSLELKFKNLEISKLPNIIAVSKTFRIEKILPLIEFGHLHYGENKVQEAIDKWSDIKSQNTALKLHLVGKLQTNKVKLSLKIFDYIHSVDNKKLAQKISDEQLKQKKKVKIFIQVNIGGEVQKSGIDKNSLKDFHSFCKNLKLDVVGLMCIPPLNQDSIEFFQELKLLNDSLKLKELSMGMSADYLDAAKESATFLRIGSSIFGPRS